jgi:hypothetical protein
MSDDIDAEYSYSLHMSGSASTLPVDDAEDIIKRLHDVIAEVTGKHVEVPARPRIGFL